MVAVQFAAVAGLSDEQRGLSRGPDSSTVPVVRIALRRRGGGRRPLAALAAESGGVWLVATPTITTTAATAPIASHIRPVRRRHHRRATVGCGGFDIDMVLPPG